MPAGCRLASICTQHCTELQSISLMTAGCQPTAGWHQDPLMFVSAVQGKNDYVHFFLHCTDKHQRILMPASSRLAHSHHQRHSAVQCWVHIDASLQSASSQLASERYSLQCQYQCSAVSQYEQAFTDLGVILV